MDVGVRELKANLSAWLDRAAAGEIVRITDRGVPKAILAPLPGRLHLDDGVAEGWVRPHIDKTFPLAEVGAAQDYIEQRRNTGKVVLIP